MTKLLAFGDLHLDAGVEHRADAYADHEAALEEIADLAAEEDVDLILFGGDAYHRPHATDRARHVMRRFTRRLERCNIPMIGVLGNASHDLYGTDRETALELEESRLIRISRHAEVIVEFAGVAVCTLPSAPVARLVAARNGGDRGHVYQEAAELLVETARGLRASPIIRRPAILLGHWSVTGAAYPNGLPADGAGEPVLRLEDLDDIGFDAIVLSHIHNPVRLEAHTPAVYTGSPLTLNFGEAHVPHGVWILDVDETGPGALKFLPLAGRPFVTVDVDLTSSPIVDGLGETDTLAAHLVADSNLDGEPVIRLRYRATEDQHRRVDQTALRRLVDDAGGRLYQIAPNIIREQRARAEHVDETLDPIMAVQAWADTNEITGDRANELVDLTRELLEVA